MDERDRHARPARTAPIVLTALLGLLSFACLSHAADEDEAPPPAKHPDPQVDALLDRIEAHAKSVKTLSAKIVYTRLQGLLGDKQIRIGTLRYAAGPPAKFNLHLTQRIINRRPTDLAQNWIFDGVWLVERDASDPGNKRFIKRQVVPPDADASAKDPLALGEGPFPIPVKFDKQRVLNRYHVALIPPPPPEDKADNDEDKSIVHLRLTPKVKGGSDLVKIDLWYDRETLTPIKASTLDESENESIITLRDVKTNAELPDDAFSTKPPQDRGWLIEIKPWDDNG